MSDRSLFPRSILDKAFPEGFVAALTPSASEAIRILDTLSHVGLARDDVLVLPGERALEIDASHHPSLSSAPARPGEVSIAQEFLAGVMLGDVLIGVRTRSTFDALAIEALFAEEGARPIHHFGPVTKRALSEASA